MADLPAPSTPPYARMAFHAVLAAVIFFCVNRFALEQPLDMCLLWAAVAAPFAAGLAYSQAIRGR